MDTFQQMLASWCMWFGSFFQLSVSLCSSLVSTSAEDALNQEVAASPKTEMVGSTKQGQWRCRGECQCLQPPADFRLCRTKRHSSALKVHFQLWGRTTEKLEATRRTRCGVCVRAQAEVREEEIRHQRLIRKFQRWRWKIGIPETKRHTVTWPCQGQCQSTKPIAQFQRWRKKTGSSEPTKYTRCDACLEAQMKERVDMYCPRCSTPITVAISIFWEREPKNRFKNARCLSTACKNKVYNIGGWLRVQHDADATIRAWLEQNSCLQASCRPTRMTVDLYRTQPNSAVVTSIPKGLWTTKRDRLLQIRRHKNSGWIPNMTCHDCSAHTSDHVNMLRVRGQRLIISRHDTVL